MEGDAKDDSPLLRRPSRAPRQSRKSASVGFSEEAPVVIGSNGGDGDGDGEDEGDSGMREPTFPSGGGSKTGNRPSTPLHMRPSDDHHQDEDEEEDEDEVGPKP